MSEQCGLLVDVGLDLYFQLLNKLNFRLDRANTYVLTTFRTQISSLRFIDLVHVVINRISEGIIIFLRTPEVILQLRTFVTHE